MGNYISCTLSTPAGGKNSSATTVIFPSGEIRQFHEPMKAAELMFEMPNFFLVNSQSLHVGRRFSPLTADEDLEMANLYVMFPMKKVNSVVSVADMGVLFLFANSASKQVSGGKIPRIVYKESANVLSEDVKEGEEESEEKLDLNVLEEFSTPQFKHRMSMCRSRKPLLETIAEEPMFSR